MSMKYTRASFKCILIPVIFLLVFLLLLTLACITEGPTNRSGIYIVFSVISIFIAIFLPAVNVICAIIGIIFQIFALRNHEPKGKIIIQFAVSAIYILLPARYGYLFYLGIISA